MGHWASGFASLFPISPPAKWGYRWGLLPFPPPGFGVINGVFTSSTLSCVTWSRPRPIAAQLNPNAEYLLVQVKNDVKKKKNTTSLKASTYNTLSIRCPGRVVLSSDPQQSRPSTFREVKSSVQHHPAVIRGICASTVQGPSPQDLSGNSLPLFPSVSPKHASTATS